MQWGKNLSQIGAIALAGTSVFAMSPADAKSREGTTYTIYGQSTDFDSHTRLVSYRDLDLATSAGEKTLNRRVRGAVRIVCSEPVPGRNLRRDTLCHNFAWGGARPQIALAVMRAREIASTGTSAIPPVAMTLSIYPG